MKLFRIILKNILRNKVRTFLTVCSVAASLFLVTLLLTMLFRFSSPPNNPASALRLVTRHRVSIFNGIPKAYREKIAGVEGVSAVVGSMWFGGKYKDKSNPFAQFAVDVDDYFKVHPDMVIPEDQKRAFLQTRSGAIAGRSVAETYGWKIGDRIHLQGTLFPVAPELTLVGIYDKGPGDGSMLFFQWNYLNELYQGNFSIVGTYEALLESPDAAAQVAEKIDAMFRNSSRPTLTEGEGAFISGFLNMLGNVQFLIGSICLAVIFTIVLVAANSMAMSVRERVKEVAVLKALGFRAAQILGLILGESVSISVLGAFLGCGLAFLLLRFVHTAVVSGGFLPKLSVSPTTFALGLAVGALVGLLSAGLPAWRIAHRPAAAAMRAIV